MLGSVLNDIAGSPVFVGRSQELAALLDALARAASGEPQALLVGGEAGVGKTRLLDEYLTRARAAGAVTAVGGCLELGADGLPFAPFATALRALHRTLGADALSVAAGGREAELARLLPDLAPAHPGAAAEGRALREAWDEEDGRARLFELTAQLLERLTAERTVVLALEDLHWADRSTRELLGYLYRSLQAPSRLVLLATYRADDIHRRHPLRPFLAETDRLRTVRRIDLPRLNRDEVRAQIAGIQGVAEPPRDLVASVYARTDGNPYFVEELTHHGATCSLSDTLRDLLLVRVEALPEEAQQVVQVAAQGGSAVEHALLAAVRGLPADELRGALRAVVGANVLIPTDDGDGYRFRHALLREAVSEDLLPGEGAGLSRQYARALEADPSLVRAEVRATRLAHYWYRGRDAAKALPAVLAASVEARARHAFAEQHQLLERAVELWEDVPEDVRAALRPVDHAEVYPPCAGDPGEGSLRFMDLLAETVVAARVGGELERALAVAKRALALLDEGRDPLRAAWFWVQRARLAEGLARGDGWDEISRAQELVRGLPPSAVHAEVLASAAGWGMKHDPGPDTLSTALQAVGLARVVGARHIEQNARITLGVLMVQGGDVGAGLAEIGIAQERAAGMGEFGLVIRAGTNLAAELEYVGRSEEAVAAAADAARTAAAHGRRNQRAFALGNQAESLHALGRWDEAAEVVEEARQLAVWPHTRASQEVHAGELALDRGDLAAVEAARRTAAEQYARQRRPEPQSELPLRRFALALAAGRGDWRAARAETTRVLDEGLPVGTHPYVWPLLHTAVRAEADLLGLPDAEDGRAELLARLRVAARRLPHPAPVWTAWSLLVAAELDRAEGRSDPRRWADAVAALAPLERPFQLAQARQRLAEALLDDGGDRAEAARMLRAAHGTARRLGARALLEETAQLAARARIAVDGDPPRGEEQDPAPGDPADSFGLTARERDVLGLVAAGRSNRQIAERLFISPKTASVHVSRILAKLGVAGRGEAAAMAHRLRLVGPEPEPEASERR
ncbi:ATP-binding protein [Streptomyces hazeniae]